MKNKTIMSRKKKFIFGLFGLIIGLCLGSLLRNYRTLEIISVCNLNLNAQSQSEYFISFFFILFSFLSFLKSIWGSRPI